MATYYGDSGLGSPRRFSFFPPMIKALLVSNVAVFILQMLIGSLSFNNVPLAWVLERYFALIPFEGVELSGGVTAHFYPWQLLSFQFMHGGLMHLFFNMLALWMFGVELEAVWGSRRFLVYYLLSGVGAGLVHLLVAPLLGGIPLPTVGASGGVYAILLAFGMTFPNRPVVMFPILFPVPARILVIIYAGVELIAGITNTNSGVAHFAHLGGALVGFLLLKFGDTLRIYWLFDKIATLVGRGPKNSSFQKRRRVYTIESEPEPRSSQTTTPSWFRTEPQQDVHQGGGERLFEPTPNITQEQIDRILDKISRYGYNSLSDVEKKTLHEASKKF